MITTYAGAADKPITDPPDPNPRTPTLQLPAGEWDCLIHVYGPPDQFPFHPDNPYRSTPVLPETYIRQQKTLGLSKAVIANGVGYGFDRRYLLQVLAEYPERFRGVAYIEDNAMPSELQRLRSQGVMGARFVGAPAYPHLPQLTSAMAKKPADAGTHVEFLTFTRGGMAAEKQRILAMPHTIVIDHFGRLDPARDLDDPGFTSILDLRETGRVWLKMSNPAFCTGEDFPYAPVLPYACALVAHARERLLWASNWPHVMRNGRAMPNDGDLIDLIADWVPEGETRRRFLVSNPEELYMRA